MSFRDRATSEPVTAEAARLNGWAGLPTEDLVAWEAELLGMEQELREMRLELAHSRPMSLKPDRTRTIRLRELALRVADMRRACWGD